MLYPTIPHTSTLLLHLFLPFQIQEAGKDRWRQVALANTTSWEDHLILFHWQTDPQKSSLWYSCVSKKPCMWMLFKDIASNKEFLSCYTTKEFFKNKIQFQMQNHIIYASCFSTVWQGNGVQSCCLLLFDRCRCWVWKECVVIYTMWFLNF